MFEALPVQPYDVNNQLLVSNVHPPDWANPEPAGRYNLVVLGAGTAGAAAGGPRRRAGRSCPCLRRLRYSRTTSTTGSW